MKLLLAILLLTGCMAGQGRAADKDYTHRIERVDGNSVCSATAVGQRTLLSAAHCFKDKPGVIVVDGIAVGVLGIELDGKDHALVTVTITFANVAKVSTTATVGPAQGARVHWYGQPMGLEQVYGEGIVVGMRDDRYLLDANIWFGVSGAGLFNERGEVVGVVSGILGEQIYKLGFAWPLAFTQEQWRQVK